MHAVLGPSEQLAAIIYWTCNTAQCASVLLQGFASLSFKMFEEGQYPQEFEATVIMREVDLMSVLG